MKVKRNSLVQYTKCCTFHEVTTGLHPRLYSNLEEAFVLILVLNEMVLVLVLDCLSARVRVRVLPFGRSTSTKTHSNLNVMFQDLGNDEAINPKSGFVRPQSACPTGARG
jgi:hypothetical protein